jgi:predicted nucleic acid-binding protein
VNCFVDTSAFLAFLDRDDDHHLKAAEVWKALLQGPARLSTTNYVLVELLALTQNRLGLKAVRAFEGSMRPALTVHWVDSGLHEVAVASLLSQSRRRLSLVDCVSFEFMRRSGIKHYFAFDRHFREQGFAPVATDSQS